jgi:hypothetical protein
MCYCQHFPHLISLITFSSLQFFWITHYLFPFSISNDIALHLGDFATFLFSRVWLVYWYRWWLDWQTRCYLNCGLENLIQVEWNSCGVLEVCFRINRPCHLLTLRCWNTFSSLISVFILMLGEVLSEIPIHPNENILSIWSMFLQVRHPHVLDIFQRTRAN